MFKVRCSAGTPSLPHLCVVHPLCSLKSVSHLFSSLWASEDPYLLAIRTVPRGALLQFWSHQKSTQVHLAREWEVKEKQLPLVAFYITGGDALTISSSRSFNPYIFICQTHLSSKTCSQSNAHKCSMIIQNWMVRHHVTTAWHTQHARCATDNLREIPS